VVAEGVSLLTKALRSQTAPRSIAARIEQLELELEFWEDILHALERSTEKELDRYLAISTALIAEQSSEASLTVDDLEVLRQSFQGSADALNGNMPAAEAPSAEISRFLQRITAPKETRVRRFRPEFELAFRKRQLLSVESRTITAEALAEEFMSAEYQRNPESAVRNMQQGIRRVAREHERCERLGIPSPFLHIESQPDPTGNAGERLNS